MSKIWSRVFYSISFWSFCRSKSDRATLILSFDKLQALFLISSYDKAGDTVHGFTVCYEKSCESLVYQNKHI